MILAKCRQLDEDDMTLIHETLEATTTRISLVSAVINGHEKMRKFLAVELAIFSLRPFFNDLAESPETDRRKTFAQSH